MAGKEGISTEQTAKLNTFIAKLMYLLVLIQRLTFLQLERKIL